MLSSSCARSDVRPKLLIELSSGASLAVLLADLLIDRLEVTWLDTDRRLRTLPARKDAFVSPVDNAVVAVDTRPARLGGAELVGGLLPS